MRLLETWSEMRPDRIGTVIADGILAGLIAGAVVLAVFAAYDALASQLMRTPTVLHALFFDGPVTAAAVRSDPSRALVYTLIHFGAWIGAGIGAAYLARVSSVYPALWYAAVVGAALILCAFLWAAGVWGVPGLGVHHLWVGALLGACTMVAFFLRRNPALIHHYGD